MLLNMCAITNESETNNTEIPWRQFLSASPPPAGSVLNLTPNYKSRNITKGRL